MREKFRYELAYNNLIDFDLYSKSEVDLKKQDEKPLASIYNFYGTLSVAARSYGAGAGGFVAWQETQHHEYLPSNHGRGW